jgi:hypothetical protein
MSQYPPPQPPQQPYGQPSFGQQPGVPPGPRGTSGAAIGSLICGILGCIPFITGLLAVILGIVGIKATRNQARGGRAMAIIGLVLGVLSIAGWGLFGTTLYTMYVAAKPVKAVAEAFVNDMTKGDVTAASTRCDPAMSQAQLQSSAAQMQQWGALQQLILLGASVESTSGGTQWELGGSATFAQGGVKKALFTLRKQPDGSYKIVKYEFE